MAVDLSSLAQILEASLDPVQNRHGSVLILYELFPRANMHPAELAILQEEKKLNFSLSLLQIVATQTFGPTARLAGALYFKNYIKRHWTVSAWLSTIGPRNGLAN